MRESASYFCVPFLTVSKHHKRVACRFMYFTLSTVTNYVNSECLIARAIILIV